VAVLGHTRTVLVSVASFLAVPDLVAATDALALLPRALADHAVRSLPLRQFEPPLKPPAFPIHMGYHRRQLGDVGVMAVVEALRSVCTDILAPPPAS
jgi:DNA-binding transcriptional LysR family regulator